MCTRNPLPGSLSAPAPGVGRPPRKDWKWLAHATRRAAILAMVSGLVILSCRNPSAAAFGTINWLGQHAVHERMTRWALADAGIGPATLGALAGAPGSFGAVGAPDKPGRGLLGTKAAHCDGGDYLLTPGYPQTQEAAQFRLEACRAWIFSNLARAVEDAAGLAKSDPRSTSLGCDFDGHRRGSAKCLVLEDLGLAFHAAQDFYAHTNWVDRPAPGRTTVDDPPGLDNDRPAPWIDPRRNVTFPAGLISGCYDGFPERRHCGAGGLNPRVAHHTLNKDRGVIDVSARTIGQGETPRGRINENFQRAAAAAIADTRDKWAYLEEQLVATYGAERTTEIACLLRSDLASSC